MEGGLWGKSGQGGGEGDIQVGCWGAVQSKSDEKRKAAPRERHRKRRKNLSFKLNVLINEMCSMRGGGNQSWQLPVAKVSIMGNNQGGNKEVHFLPGCRRRNRRSRKAGGVRSADQRNFTSIKTRWRRED